MDFNLCSDCFSIGAKLFPHEAWHPYKVIECLEYPLFSKDWSIQEELLLLEAIEKCGLGNWKIIAEYMSGTKNATTTSGKNEVIMKEGKEKDICSVVNVMNRSAKEIESHYWDLYIGTNNSIDTATESAPNNTFPLCCSCYLPDKVYITKRTSQHMNVNTIQTEI